MNCSIIEAANAVKATAAALTALKLGSESSCYNESEPEMPVDAVEAILVRQVKSLDSLIHSE